MIEVIAELLTPSSLLRVSDLSALFAHAPVPRHREAEPEDPHRPFIAIGPVFHGARAHEQREPSNAALELQRQLPIRLADVPTVERGPQFHEGPPHRSREGEA